jgi:hypothetical protein
VHLARLGAPETPRRFAHRDDGVAMTAAILLGFDSGSCALSYDLDRRGRAALR